MREGEIIIDEQHCTGCGYCLIFCPQDCIVITGEKLNAKGYLLPSLVDAEECCKACGICAKMCPAFAIEVYRIST